MASLVRTCRWCHTLIIRDYDGRWIHTSLAYYCRDRWGVLLSTWAAPMPASVYRSASARKQNR